MSFTDNIKMTSNYFGFPPGSVSANLFPVPNQFRSLQDQMALDEQERKKLERKRARNRQAASKCRQKKMDRIKELEESVTQEKQKMARLDSEIHQLRSTLSSFQAMVQRHVSNGCQATSCRN